MHLIAGLLTMLIGVAALAMPIWRNFKEPPGSDKDHLRFKHVLIGVMTIVLGGLIASNQTELIMVYARRFISMIAGG